MRNELTIAMLALGVALPAVGQKKKLMEGTVPEVVVTGTGTQHLLKDAPVQTEVISSKTLRSYAGKSLEDILAGLTASFDFNEGDMGSQMQMNGLGNSYILVLIDGKRIHGDVGGENDLSLIDPHNIDRIEIVKGAQSALYGSDAIAGVINIITKKRDEGLLVENTTRVGSYGDVRQHNGLALRYGKVSSYTNFQLQHSDGWQNTSTENPAQTEFLITDSRNKTVNRHTNWQIAERLTYMPWHDVELYAEGSTYWKRIYRPSGKYPSCDVHSYDLEYHNASAAVGGKWKLSPTDFVSLDVDWNRHAYYYNYTDTTLTDGYHNGEYTPYFPYFPGQTQLQSDQRRTMAQLKTVLTLPFNRLSAGAEYRYDWLKAAIMRLNADKVTDWTGAVYVQDEFNLIPHVNITAGLRLTGNEQFGARLTPKASAMLSLGQFRLRAGWSQGFKTPTLKELHYRYIRQMSGTYLYLGNTDLKPQTSNYCSLGVEYSVGGLTLNATGYYNSVDNMITLVTIPNSEAPGDLLVEYQPVKVSKYKNLEDAKTYGLDFTVRYAMKDFAAGLGYSYLDTRAHEYDSDHDVLKQVTINGMAHHKGNVYATWNHAFSPVYRLGIGIFGRMSSKRYYQINGNGKGYQIWRINTSHDFSKSKHFTYRLEAGVDNIFNYVDRTYHGLHLGTTTPGTTVYVSLAVGFKQGKNLKNSYNKPNSNKHNNEED